MSLSKKLLTVAAPVALLALSACATGLPTKVTRFQAMPAPQGQSFVVQSADPRERGGLEFSRYADHVRRHLIAQGYSEAPSAQAASFVVELDYGVDQGKQEVVTYPSMHRDPWFHPFYRPYYSRFGYFGRHRRYSPFYYGWNDPLLFSPFDRDIDVYTVYTSFLDMDIRRTADGQSLFEGTAKARSRTDDLQVLVPNLVEAMFTGFPGSSGETVKITVPPPQRRR